MTLQPGYATSVPATGSYTGTMTAGQIAANVNFGLRTVAAAPLGAESNLLKSDDVELHFFA